MNLQKNALVEMFHVEQKKELRSYERGSGVYTSVSR